MRSKLFLSTQKSTSQRTSRVARVLFSRSSGVPPLPTPFLQSQGAVDADVSEDGARADVGLPYVVAMETAWVSHCCSHCSLWQCRQMIVTTKHYFHYSNAVLHCAVQSIARSGAPHEANSGRHSLVHFVLRTKMEMPPTFFRVRYFSTFLYGNGNIATV
jgi:hypothetical protein